MIYFFADNHYGVFPGKVIYEHLPEKLRTRILFYCDEWAALEHSDWDSDCELLILNMIGGTCDQPHPGMDAEKRVRRYLERGGNMLLLHGSSAAFWQWDWWRELPGERWVRPHDPDGAAPSTHPRKPYRVTLSKTRHPLAERLAEMELPEDEIYTELENTCPCMRLMETHIGEGTFVQCCEAVSPWGGRLVSFIPGHSPAVTGDPVLIGNISVLIDYLLA